MKIFLWPIPNFSLKLFFKYFFISVDHVEKYLESKYKNSYPVIVSSGRIAIKIAIFQINQGKSKKLKLFPYVSKCVKDVIVNDININDKNLNKEDIQIIYHHMGMIQDQPKSKYLIEDSVDIIVNYGENLHCLNGQIEIWSLEKMYGSIGGGVIWCKNIKIKNDIKKIIRNNFRKKNYIWVFKILSNYFKFLKNFSINMEKDNSSVPKWMAGNIYGKIIKHNHIYQHRKFKFNLVKDLLPEWYNLEENRLPPTVPLEPSKNILEIAKKYNIITENRHFELIQNNKSKFVKFFPMPIHEDISANQIISFIKEIKK